MKTNSRDPLPWALGTAVCLANLSFHSVFYNFDGVACAIAVELGDLFHLVHGNHLAYGFVGLGFYRLWQAFGYTGPAMLALQTFDSLLGGAGAGVFCALLLDLKLPRRLAAAASAGLAVSFAYWFWSLEAQVYLLGAFFLLLAAREAFRRPARPWLLGCWHSLAILGHIGHICFAPAALFLLWDARRKEGRRPARDIATYALTGVIVVGASYAAAAIFIVRPHTFDQWRVWLLGSAALTLQKDFLWHGGYSWNGLRDWLWMAPRLFTDLTVLKGAAAGLGLATSLVALGAAAVGAVKKDFRARAALLWLAAYAALFISWEPFTIVYRITDLIALWVLIALGCAGLKRPAAAVGIWVLVAGLLNWETAIEPRTRPENNEEYRQALWLASVTPPEAWIAATSLDQVYIPYFAHRRPLNLRYFLGHADALNDRLARLDAAGQPVYLTSTTLSRDGWDGFFKAYGLVESSRLDKETLYLVINGKPSGKR